MAEVAVRLGTTGTSGRIGEVTNQTMKCPGDYYFWLNPYGKKKKILPTGIRLKCPSVCPPAWVNATRESQHRRVRTASTQHETLSVQRYEVRYQQDPIDAKTVTLRSLKVSKKLRILSSPPEFRLGVHPRFSPCSTHTIHIPESAELVYIELDFETRPMSRYIEG